MTKIRPARKEEDEILARLLYNAFRLNWCTNWEHDLAVPLPEISLIPSKYEPITGGASAARLASWRATVLLTRKLGGNVDVIIAADGETPAAVSCFLPPGVRPDFISLLTSGCLFLPFQLGLRTSHRFRKNYLLAESLWRCALQTLGERLETGGSVLVLGTCPDHAGKGYAAQLLECQIQRHRAMYPTAPVYLETASDHAQRVYERHGFEETARGQVHLCGVDERGLKVSKSSGSSNEGKPMIDPYFALRCLRLAPS